MKMAQLEPPGGEQHQKIPPPQKMSQGQIIDVVTSCQRSFFVLFSVCDTAETIFTVVMTTESRVTKMTPK